MDHDRIRTSEFREGDLSEIIAIERASFPSPWTENIFRGELSNQISRIIVGRDDISHGNGVAGYIVYWLVADEMHLHNLAVRRELRRLRVASLLLEEAIRSAKSEGARRITLEVRRSNLPAQELYKKFDLSVKDIRPGYYGDTGEDALILWGEIDSAIASTAKENFGSAAGV